MGGRPRHPERAAELRALRTDDKNARIRARCATPGFGYLVLLFRGPGLGCSAFDAATYLLAKEIADRELPQDCYRSALIVQKAWNPEMTLVSDSRDSQRYKSMDDDL